MNLLFLRRHGHGGQAPSGGGGIPAGYKRLPYLMCSHSYIDAGVYGNRDTIIDFRFMVTSLNTTYNTLFGVYTQQGVEDMEAGLYNGSESYNEGGPWGYATFLNAGSGGSTAKDVRFPMNEECQVILTRYGLGGTNTMEWDASSGPGKTRYTIHVGDHNDTDRTGGYRQTGFTGRIYGCEIYNASTSHDSDDMHVNRIYVPVLKESTGECGLYDTVAGTFNVSIDNPPEKYNYRTPFQYTVFSGTATEDFTIDVIGYDSIYGTANVVSTTPVSVSNGTFNVELPMLTEGQRYSFKNRTAITSILQLPTLQLDQIIMGSGFNATSYYKPCPLSETFMGCSNLRTICPVYIGNATVLTSMFEGCSSLVSAPEINTSNVKFMDRMFYGCTSLTTVPSYDYSSILNSENTSQSSLSGMFGMCQSLVTVGGMSGLQRDVNFRGCVNLSTQSLLNIANTVSTNPRSTWETYAPEIPPTVEGNDTPTDYLNIRVSGTSGSTDAGDGSVRVRMYNDDSAKYTEAVNKLVAKGWIINN